MGNKKVVVTTKHRGVFFGEVVENNAPENVKLIGARNCIYWDMSLHGFLGLAKDGPNDKCRIGPAVESLTLYDVTSIAECTDEAVERWENIVWTA